MIRNTFAGLFLASALVVPALAQDTPTVKSIDVTLDMAAVQNAQAAAYWGTLEADLEGAILARVQPQIADDGVDISIDISEVELSNGFQEVVGIADTRLIGSVKMTHLTDNSRFDAYELTVDVNAAMPLLPEGFVMATATVDTKEYYDAMITAFANGVVNRLK